MEFFFFLDVYADRQLIDYYILTFKLRDITSVGMHKWNSRNYIREVKDWGRFVKTAYDITLYELGDEIERFRSVEEGLREGYKIAYKEASRRGAKEIVPAIGPGNPPVEVIKRVFPEEFHLQEFPKDLNKFLENIVKETAKEMSKRGKDDDAIPF